MNIGQGRDRRGLGGLLRIPGLAANRQLSLRDTLGIRAGLAFPHAPNSDESAPNGDYYLPEQAEPVGTDCSAAGRCPYCLTLMPEPANCECAGLLRVSF